MSNRLRDVAVLIADCEHKTAPGAAAGDEFGYSIGTPNLRQGRILFDSAKRVDRPTYDAWTQRGVPRAGDLILAREAPVGQVGLVPDGVPVCLGQRTVLIRPDAARVNPRFLQYRLLGPAVQQWMMDRSSGSTVAHLNVEDVRDIDLGSLPSRATQDEVAEALGALDDKIDANRRLKGCCNDLANALVERALRASAAAGELRAVRLGDVVAVNELSVKPGTGRIRYLDISSVGDGSHDEPSDFAWDDAPGRARRVARDGDVLWSTVRPNRRSHCLVDAPPDNLVVSTGFAVLTPQSVGPSYLYAVTDRDEFVDYLNSVAEGSAYPAVRAERFVEAQIPMPGRAALAECESATMPLRRRAAAAARESRILALLRDTLLPPLISGELRVRDAESLVGEAV